VTSSDARAGRPDRGRARIESLSGSVVVHAFLALALYYWAERQPKEEKKPPVVLTVFTPPPKPLAPPPPPPPPPPVQTPVAVVTPKPVVREARPRPKAAPKPPPPTNVPPPPENTTPAPGPPSTDPNPAPTQTFKIDDLGVGAGMAVPAGPATSGSPWGKKGGTGTGTGGGGDPASTGTGPAVVSLDDVKSQPEPIGAPPRIRLKDYPAEAARLGIEGQVLVRILVDEKGRATQPKIVKGLGYGLDEKALAFVKELRFKPARDMQDRPVPVRITWTFHFYPPED
jgi:protein TonB